MFLLAAANGKGKISSAMHRGVQRGMERLPVQILSYDAYYIN
jgi:hypothetical protein